jgi:hypothetical protein
MCERHAIAAAVGGTLPVVALPEPATGSRRKRLWEMPSNCHCPVIGVCLPIGVLRRVLGKALGGEVQHDDYEAHVGAVSECGVRNRVSEALQRELDRRCAIVLRRFALARTTAAVQALWCDAVAAGDIAAALWATLSHARCDADLQQLVLREVHMIQHQAGAANRADLQRVDTLASDNQRLAQELERLHQRSVQAQAERQADIERLSAALVQARAQLIGRDTLLAAQRAQLEDFQQHAPDLPARRDLARRLENQLERNRTLQAQINLLHDSRAVAAEPERPEPATEPPAAPPDLAERSVLCVGGRSGSVTQYRDVVERHGGRFLHHDGGLEDNPHRLESSLAAADVVICQAGCLSHNAYWRVKDHCKRHGKRCVYLDQPGVAGFERGLARATPA